MPYCAVRFCGTNNMTEDFRKDNITFHRFPNDPALKLKWVQAVRLKKERWYPSNTSMVCSLHFKEECFQWHNKQKRLLYTAVPTERLYMYNQRQTQLQNLHTKCKTKSSKLGPKCKHQENSKADKGKLMICKVYRYLEAEYKKLRCYYGEDCDLTPLSDILWRTAEATGVSKETVTTVLINEPFVMEKNEASIKPMLDRDCQDPERLNEPAHEFARLPPAPVPLPKVSLPKVPLPKVSLPKVPLPKVPLPKVSLPKVPIPKLPIPKLPTPKADGRKLPPPPPVTLVLLTPVGNAHGVANTAENLLVQQDNPNEQNYRFSPAALHNMSSTQVQATTNPMQLVLFTYDQPQQKDSAPNQCNDAISDTGVTNITVESDLAEFVLKYDSEDYNDTKDNLPQACDVDALGVTQDLSGINHVYPSEIKPEMVLIKEEVTDVASDEQYKPEDFTVADDNIPYTCDVEMPAVKAEPESHDAYGQYYGLPMELPVEFTSEKLMIKEENTDDELDDINNNVLDFSNKTDEIKMNPANNETEHMKVSLDSIIWHPAELPVKYEPRDEFTNYYKNFA